MPNTTTPNALATLTWTNLAAQSAEQISLAAVPIVAVIALNAGPGEIGALSTAQTLPFLLLSIPAGMLADRWSRTRLMVAAEALRALSLFGLLALVLGQALSLPLLALLGFVGAAGTVGFSVAAPALVPALVPKSALARANARLELARSIAFAAGPAVAGALVAWAGASIAFACADRVVGVRGVVAVAAAERAGAAGCRAAPPARRAARRRRAGVAASAVEAGDVDRGGVEHLVVRAAGGVRALCDAPPRARRRRRGPHARLLWRRHADRRHPGRARGARAAVRRRGAAGPVDVGVGRGRDAGQLVVAASRRGRRCRSCCSAPARWCGR